MNLSRFILKDEQMRSLDHFGKPVFTADITFTEEAPRPDVFFEKHHYTATAKVSVGFRCDPGEGHKMMPIAIRQLHHELNHEALLILERARFALTQRDVEGIQRQLNALERELTGAA